MFWLVLAGLVLLLQPGLYMNDEQSQAAGLWTLSQGHWYVHGELPPGYEESRGSLWFHFGLPAADGPPRAPVGSNMLNVLALPLRLGLGAVADVVGATMAVTLAAAVVIGLGARAAASYHARQAINQDWLGGVAGGLVLLGGWLMPEARYVSPYLEIASLQLVTAAFTAFSVVLLYDVLGRYLDPRQAVLGCALYLVATPALFWSLNIKYHGMALALAVVALWCYQEGPRSAPLRTALAFAVAGLALWNHTPSGVLLLGMLGILSLGAAWPLLRSRGLAEARIAAAGLAKRAGAGALGLAVGLVPEFLNRLRDARADLPTRYVNIQPGKPVPGGVEGVVQAQVERGYLRGSVFNDPGWAWDALKETMVWTQWMHSGVALSALSLAPFVILAFLMWVQPAGWRRIPVVLQLYAILAFVLTFALIGGRLLNIGAGFDIRYAALLWPFLLLSAVAPVADVATRMGWRPFLERTGTLALLILLGVGLFNFVYHVANGVEFVPKGYAFEFVWFHRYVGLLVALLLGVLAAARWRGEHIHPVLGQLYAWSVVAAVALAASFQVLVQLGPARGPGDGSFVVLPVDYVARFVEWLYYSQV
jgi:hypothetical protein